MSNYVLNTGGWFLAIVLVAVGIGLIIRAVMDLWKAWGGAEKDHKSALVGIGIGIVGGLLLAWGSTALVAFFTSKGSEVPHS